MKIKPGSIVVVAGLLGILAVAIYFAWTIWAGLGDVEMSGHGVTALVLGVVMSVALGGGLMFLVFYSNRKGHDDEVQ